MLGTATQTITIPDLGSTIDTAAEVALDEPIVLDFFCGPQGGNAEVDAFVAIYNLTTQGSVAGAAAVAGSGYPFSFGTPAELGLSAGDELQVGVICSIAQGDEALLTSQRWVMVTVGAAAPKPPVKVDTAA